MRWKAVVNGLVLASGLVIGCKQQCFMCKEDYLSSHAVAAALPRLECDSSPILPAAGNIPTPMTVLDTERQVRYMSLNEAICLALENGTVGRQQINLFGSGEPIDEPVGFTGRFVTGDDAIRAFALDPAIVHADIEAALSKFDVRWNTSLTWQRTDRPVGTTLDVLQAGNITAIDTNQSTFTTSLIKPLPTGGVAGITFTTDYQLTNLQARVNPAYRPSLQFAFEQPLLQGFGVEINQIRNSHPGSIITPFNIAARVEGIIVTRIRFDQQRAEFERLMQLMLLNVEGAYWRLYGAYWTLYSREQALRQAYEAWKINKARFEAGRIPIQDFAQSRQQYELFRGQRITALGEVLERERKLRALIGLPVEDGTRIVPCDAPTLAPYHPDWCVALNEALALQPSLILAREDVKFRQIDLINVKNLLLPDLRFTSTYDINGLGSRLDGPISQAGPGANAFRNFAGNHFNNWSLGLRMEVPLGFRDASANVRAARLQLARSFAVLRDQELKIQRLLAQVYRQLFENYEQIEAQRALRLAAATQLEARFKEFLAGRGTLDFLLEAQRVWADALRSEYDAIVNYNINLATFQAVKGTILQYNNVYITEGPLPQCAQKRALAHAEERTRQLVLRQRTEPVPHCTLCRDGSSEPLSLPALPGDAAVPLPALFSGNPPLPEDVIKEPVLSPAGSEPLPSPRPLERSGEARPQEPRRLPPTPTELPQP
jgi:outer membrane protein TolC